MDTKNAIIVGGTSGIGLAVAKNFLAKGLQVAVIGRDELKAQEAEAELTALASSPGQVQSFSGDASDRPAMEAIYQTLMEKWKTLDILVHVAGISGRKWGDGPLDECTEEGWNVVMNNNLTSVFHSNQLALRIMKRQRSGSIVNISSILGMVGAQDHFVTHAYAASRGAVISMSRSAAVYFAKDGIRINTVCPGLLDTPMSQRAINNEEIREALTYLQPLSPHIGYPQDVASAVAFLASDEAKFITGIALPVDGGWLAQ
ncbi:SDR family NAD(P)-dependent oxidoreductase [Paenibacillus solisilvae]|uniref:SDR family NAD(P)-dependent oxidoreductase n=1 Tax=Paenibacillus solisilvae TaxID=2486751 RepID=A0ABW0WA17_9BACL